MDTFYGVGYLKLNQKKIIEIRRKLLIFGK